MRRGDTYAVQLPDGTWETRTVNWWTEAQYHPWNPWYTSHHMIWAVPAYMAATVLLAAIAIGIINTVVG